MRRQSSRQRAAVCLLLCCASAALGAEEDEVPPAAKSALPTLSREQQRAGDLRIAHPVAARAPERIEALGVVLDPTTLLSDVSEWTVAVAAEHSASAELTRLRELNRAGAGASLKMIEAAEADAAKSQAQVQLARARLELQWGPWLAQPPAARQKILDEATTGSALLVRADLPGRHSVAAVPPRALLNVDGIEVPGRVLGALRVTGEAQSAALLIEAGHVPAGVGPGARVPLALLAAERSGFVLPRDAVLYDERGAYVYKQLAEGADRHGGHYAPVEVRLLQTYGDGWLAAGIDGDDEIVVHGAGLLWSLQGMGSRAVDDDQD